MIKVLGKLTEHSNQRNVVYDHRECCCTLQSAMGTGGGQVPLIIVKRDKTYVQKSSDI